LYFGLAEESKVYEEAATMTRYDSLVDTEEIGRIRTDSSSTEINNKSVSASDSLSLSPAVIPDGAMKESINRRPQQSNIPYDTTDTTGADLNQDEYFCGSESSPYPSKQFRSPMSEIATPPSDIDHTRTAALPPAFVLPSAAAFVQSPNSYSTNSSSIQNHPQLYSAIGSLEDPATNSLSHWNQDKGIIKYEFPSNTLLKPMSTAQQRNKESNGWKNKVTGNRYPKQQKKAGESTSHTATTSNDDMETKRKVSPREGKAKSTASTATKLQSNLKTSKTESDHGTENTIKHVTISELPGKRPRNKKKGPMELFRPSSDAYTPRMGKKQIKYKPAEMRTPVQTLSTSLGTLQRPNFRDALRRVAMILHEHVTKIEHRFESKTPQGKSDDLFREDMKDIFSEEHFASPTYKCTMVRVPMARGGMVYGLKKMRRKFEIPSENEIYEFAHQLFKAVQLSSECSIVCLIYVERLMEASKVPLLASTWRPIFLCGLLLASKVWQDLSSWNIEFASVYPQFSLDSINRLEILFLRMIKWDLYISSSCYAKYYFALRSLVEKPDFRQRYNRMVGLDSVQASEALKIEKRSSQVKEEAISQLSRSM
jgi:hypothetical protein